MKEKIIEIIKQAYQKKREIPEEYELLEKGQFVSSDIDEVISLANFLKPFIKPKSKIIDLGSGDGRVAFILASLWEDVEVTGIEYNSVLFDCAQRLKSEFKEYLNVEKINFIQKDFFEEDLNKYDVLYYCFWGTWEEKKLIEKLNKETKSGTILIIYGPHLKKFNPEKAFKNFYKILKKTELTCILKKI